MTVAYETSHRGWSSGSQSAICLEDKYEVLKDIGDGSFGSVVLGRTRSAGAHIVKRGTLVAIKTMKKTFENFNQCLELREVIFLKSLPNHPHLVPAYDIFLDPLSKKLHISMEYMDGNLYQLMKSREHKYLDSSSVKSILCQILSGLEHIHEHSFFHRDIKPENILVSTSATESSGAFKRYSALVTPPSTPPTYTIKIADFGLARETHSRIPYTTYVSTRWYRAPEVLLRAGEYSAPVDIWAIGAMAVEIATLKPLFPGSNEVDQVWRVCEIMGSPGSWVNRNGQRVGGGEWKDGIKLAQKLGFSFPKMPPHSLETILPAPQWPASLAHFVTWCLMWDPKARPTSRQALEHEYFADAVDPLRPKSGYAAKVLGRKPSAVVMQDADSNSTHSLTNKTSSWFRKSAAAKEMFTVSEQPVPVAEQLRPAPVHAKTTEALVATTTAASTVSSKTPTKERPANIKRSTWTNGTNTNSAPMAILPSIKPISPLPDTSMAQAQAPVAAKPEPVEERKKVGRQLSLNSHGNHYADLHRQEAERALEGNGLKSPTGSQRESFFSHLRKRARRLSGRGQSVSSPNPEDMEPGCAPWAVASGINANQVSYRQSVPDVLTIAPLAADPALDPSFAELDRALQSVRYSLDTQGRQPNNPSINSTLKRQSSLPQTDGGKSPSPSSGTLFSNRTRRSVRHTTTPHYDTPDEEDELLDEALASARKAVHQLDHTPMDITPKPQATRNFVNLAPYLTPSPSKDRNGVNFGGQEMHTPSKPVQIPQPVAKNTLNPQWPTPPYDENDWAAAAAASIFATQAAFR